MLVAHVAAEDLHGGDAEREREERLIHRVGDETAEAVFADGIHRGDQIELHALRRAGERQAVNGEHENEHQQAEHHDLRHALKTLLQAEGADKKARNDHDLGPERHFAGEGEHRAEGAATSSVLMPEWNAPVRNLPK